MTKSIYWNGAYYSALSKDVEVLKQQAPHLYSKLFPRAEYKERNEKIQVYQIFYDKHSFENLDAGFIPYQTKSPPHNFENDVILNIPEAATATVALFNVRTTFYVLFATRNK